MKTSVKALLILTAGLASPAPAFAHSGDHSHLLLTDAAAHLLGSPFHLAGIVGVALIAGVILWKAKARR